MDREPEKGAQNAQAEPDDQGQDEEFFPADEADPILSPETSQTNQVQDPETNEGPVSVSGQGDAAEGLRRSSRPKKLTEKAKLNKGEDLSGKFFAGYLDMLTTVEETKKILKVTPLDYEEISFKRTDISARLNSLQGLADALNEIQVEGVNLDDVNDTLDCLIKVATKTISDIVAALSTKKNNEVLMQVSEKKSESVVLPPTSRRSSAKASRSGKASTTSSKRIAAAAEAAALKAKLEAQKVQNRQLKELELLEMEENARRKEAEARMAQIRRNMEEEELAAQLEAKEAELKVYEENEDARSNITVRSSAQLTRSSKQPVVDVPAKQEDVSPGTILQLPPKSLSTPTRCLNVEAPIFRPPPSICRDNESLIETLTRTMTLSRLPIPEPPIFTGDPLQYPDWVSSFSSLIECRGIPPTERIHYLKRYLGGPAKEAVSGFFLLRSENAFQQAKDVLERRFGNSFLISEAFRSKLDSWPKVQGKDGKGLQNLSDFLQQCLVASAEVHDLGILNDMREIKKVTCKLPDWLGHRWNRTTAKVKRNHGRYPSFQEFVSFVAEEADIANDPIVAYEANKTGKERDNHSLSQKNRRSATQPMRITLATNSQPVAPNSNISCLFCKRQYHIINECRDFARKPMEFRREFVKKEGLCFGCLDRGHMSKNCTNRGECKRCSKRHPTSLHEDTAKHPSSDVKSSKPGSQTSSTRESSTKEKEATCREVMSDTDGPLTSMVVPVYVSSQENPDHEILVYALLDTMSDTTFILDSVGGELKTSSDAATLRLTTMTDQSTAIPCRKYGNLFIRGFNSDRKISLPTTYTRDYIPLDEDHIPTPDTASKWPHLNRLANLLAPKQDCPVGLLIGYNCPRALAPRNCALGTDDQPFAVETELGWSIVGGSQAHPSESFDAFGQTHQTISMEVQVPIKTDKPSTVQYVCKPSIKEVTSFDLLKMMEKDFHDDDSRLMSQEDIKFIALETEGIHQRSDGYYEMPLPFKDKAPCLPNNRQAALHRSLGLLKQFQRRPKYHEHYSTFMKEILRRGDAERVPSEEIQASTKWYIPHHGVYHPKKPDKVRVVFDCSARYQGTSLNDHLLPRPDLINPLIGVLCRFREHPIALTCDVEKMFHQFRVNSEHRDYLRFLWWEGDDLSKPPVDYRMKVHLFGAVSSPACANFALKRLSEDYQTLGKEASDFLRKDFYVDDGLKSEPTADAMKNLIHNAVEICAKGNLRLHKIISNSPEVMESIPESERGSVTKTSLNPSEDGASPEKVLGLQWCIESDSFCFRLTLKDHPLTRRGILATVASVYDPLGLIAPLVLVGRKILQRMCQDKLNWDQPIPDDLRPEWEQWRAELLKLGEIKVARCLSPKNFGQISSVQLHHFSDASLSGYGQCSYVRLQNEEGLVHCSLVMAKARVSPLKPVTVPRLELQAATISTKVSKVLESEMNYENMSHHFWTDSKVVLGYIRNETKRFQMFVANRVQKIRQDSKPEQWNYVATEENPADHASRGLTADEIITTNWLKGPGYLWESEVSPQAVDLEIPADDVEVKKAVVHAVTSSHSRYTTFEERLQRFSSWTKAVTAVSTILNCCLRKKGISLSKLELRRKSEESLIRVTQKEAFQEELRQIKGGSTLKSKSSPLKQLDPFIDGQDVLRVGGRLKRAAMMYGVKHPVILPKGSHLSQLIALHHHQKTAHQGRNMTINAIRSSGYWIIGCRPIVSSLIIKCVTCTRYRGKPRGQKMADLPEERLGASPPFTYCGLDCFGPFLIKEGRKELKKYGLILTCLAMRAIHIEVLDDMSTDAFLNSLRCFIALRGKVRLIRCDQGSNFVGAKHELKQSLKELDSGLVASKLLEQDCEFQLNPPSSSHMGGVWERQIRNVRNVLNGILDDSGTQLNTSSLRTLMYEAMAIVNSRPLTVENLESPDGPTPLTPNHVLTMKSGVVMPPPPGKFVREDLYLKKRWRRVQFLVNLFWARWRKEYLQTLQSRKTWTEVQKNISIDDIVLLQDNGHCRTDWQMAKVVEVYPSEDGLVRKVKLLMATADLDKKGKPLHKRTFLERPVHKLVVLSPYLD